MLENLAATMLMRMQSHRTSLDTDTGTPGRWTEVLLELAACKALAIVFPATQPLRPSPAGRVGPGEREGYGGPCDVTSLSLSLSFSLSFSL